MSQAPVVARTSWWATVRTVAWSFLGLRARVGLERDVQQIKPLHVVLVGFVGVFVFVGGLAALVHWIVPG
jgi:predicted Na+-dependent transporter